MYRLHKQSMARQADWLLSEQTSCCSSWQHHFGQNFQGPRQHKTDTTFYKMPTTVLLHPKCSVKCTAGTSNRWQDKQIDCWVNKSLVVVLDGVDASRDRAHTKLIWQQAKCQQQYCCTQIVVSNVPLVLAIKSKTSRLNVEWANLSL